MFRKGHTGCFRGSGSAVSARVWDCGTSGRVGWGCHHRAGGWGRSALTPLQGTKGLSLFLLGVLKWESGVNQKAQGLSHPPAQFHWAAGETLMDKSYEMLTICSCEIGVAASPVVSV